MLSVSYISWESWVLFLLFLCSLMMCANNWVHYDLMVVFLCLHITLPDYSDVSVGIELSKMLVTYILLCVSKIKSVPIIILHAMYGAVCIQLTHFCYDDCENTCTLSCHHRQIGSMTHLPLFRVRSWNNGMHCMSFHVLTQSVFWLIFYICWTGRILYYII